MEPWYRLTIALGRVAMRGLDLTTRVRGEEHVPTAGPALLASVHVSYPDFLFLGQAALARGRHVRFLSRHDVWRVPGVGAAMTGMRHVPVDREAPAAAYLRARRLLEEGEVVCGFPEAGISYSFTVRSLMRGVAALARETGVPVVPTVLWGSQRIASVGIPVDGRGPGIDLRRGRTVDVRFGTPMPVAPGDDLVETTRELGAPADHDARGAAAAAGAPAGHGGARAVASRAPRRARARPPRGAAARQRAARRGPADVGAAGARPGGASVKGWGPCRSDSGSRRTP